MVRHLIKVFILELCPLRSSIAPIAKWCTFNRLNYEVITDMDNMFTDMHMYSPRPVINVLITSDLYPSVKVLDAIDRHKNVSTDIIQDIIIDKLYSSFIIVFKLTDPCKILKFEDLPIDKTDNTLIDTDKNSVNYKIGHSDIVVNNDIDQMMSLRWDYLMEVFHKFNSTLCKKYMTNMWMNDCQRKGVINNPKWFYEQCSHTIVLEKEQKGVATFEEIKEIAKNRVFDFETLFNDEACSHVYQTDVSGFLLRETPFAARGPIQAVSLQDRRDTNMNITVVSFFYDLGYDGTKSKSSYETNGKYFSEMPYPIVFFGDNNTTKSVDDQRIDLSVVTYTKVNDINNWDLISYFEEEFKTEENDKLPRYRKKYALLTCLKIYAIEEAIEINPFSTPLHAWVDYGLFRRNSSIVDEKYFSQPILDKISVKEGKLTVLTTASPKTAGTTYEEFSSQCEQVLSGIMIGDKKTWSKFIPIYKDFVEDSFRRGMFCTEQVIISRLVGLHPDLFNLIEMSYDSSSFSALFDGKLEGKYQT